MRRVEWDVQRTRRESFGGAMHPVSLSRGLMFWPDAIEKDSSTAIGSIRFLKMSGQHEVAKSVSM